MRSVVESARGTAYIRLGNFCHPGGGKTGTAESGTADPHAWFAGYSLAGRADKPDIAVVVLVNNQGEGSDLGAAHLPPRDGDLLLRQRPDALPVGVEFRHHPTARDARPPPHKPYRYSNTCPAVQDPGLIVRSQSGFFTVQTESGIVTCQPARPPQAGPTPRRPCRGRRPGAGHAASRTARARSRRSKPRRTSLVRLDPRPQGIYQQVLLANPDQAVFVFACANPSPHLRMLDRFLVIAEKQGIPAVIVANKVDLVGQEAGRGAVRLLPAARVPGRLHLRHERSGRGGTAHAPDRQGLGAGRAERVWASPAC